MKQHAHHKAVNNHPHPGFERSYSSSPKAPAKTVSEKQDDLEIGRTRIRKPVTNSDNQKQIVNEWFVYGDEDSDEQSLYFKRNN